jgi:hypothetical protein
MHFTEVCKQPVTRRSLLKFGMAGALASQLTLLEQAAWLPQRMTLAASALPDIQHAIGNFIAPAFTQDGVLVRFGPVFTLFIPARLRRTPTQRDAQAMTSALNTIESVFPFSPAGVFTFVGYGLPYFRRLPSSVVGSHMPQATGIGSGAVLQEAVASPTDVASGNGITKKNWNVPVRIESNDMLFTLRSDSLQNLTEIVAWLEGSNVLGGRLVASPAVGGLLQLQTPRLMFQQIGLPRKVANAANLPYRAQINPGTPMWMGFGDQQVAAAGPPEITTFAGNATAHLTTAKAGDYFDNGSIQHLSHDILDLAEFYQLPSQDPAGVGEPFTERVQYAFRSNQLNTTNGLPAQQTGDGFTNGGGPVFIENTFQGFDDALRAARDSGGTFSSTNATRDATFEGEHRLGHNQCLQRSSRAADGTPIHIRMDGTGFDSMDVPNGSNQPKLQFMAFVPSAPFFRTMRVNQASLDLQQQFGVDPDDNGFERFITATRRQNFLTPPRRHRVFPLLELTWTSGHRWWRIPLP